jgi:hypothetical protein
MKELIKGGSTPADPPWEDRHPTTFLYEKSDAIKWLERRAKERARKRDGAAVPAEADEVPARTK